MRLAIIGCGNIARQHVIPMQNAGFKIVGIAGRLGGSKSLDLFSSDFNLKNLYKDPQELLNSRDWDALLLSCPTKDMLTYLKSSMNINKPILIEKPITYNYKDLIPYQSKENLCVGLNRRFYKTISKAKNFVTNNQNIFIKVTIPETLKELDINKNGKIPNKTFENSIHIFDALVYLVGEIKWLNVNKIYENKNLKAISAIGSSNKCQIIQLNNYYNNSDNFSIEILSDKKRLLLKPLEISYLFDGMTVKEPSKDSPLRTYHPKLKEKFIETNEFKPGFKGQANEFMKFCKNKKVKIAKIKDLYTSLKLIDDLN